MFNDFHYLSNSSNLKVFQQFKVMKHKIIFLVLSLFLFSACQDKEVSPIEEIEAPALGTQDVQVFDHVKVISSENRWLHSAEEGELVFDIDAKLEGVKVGDVLASDVAPNAPYGYLRKIMKIEKSGGKYLFSTVHATLDEVFSNANVHIEQEMIKSMNQNPNYRLDGDGYFRVKLSKTQDKNGGGFVEGYAKIRPRFTLAWNRSGTTTNYFKMSIGIDVKEFEITGRFGVFTKKTLLPIGLPPITIPLGGVPVVFKNTFKADFSAKFFAGKDVSLGMYLANGGSVSAGLEYTRNSGWKNIGHLDLNMRLSRPNRQNSTVEVRLEFPDLVIEAEPYGIGAFKFFGRAFAEDRIVFQNTNVNFFLVPVVQAGVKTKFFGFDAEHSFRYDFNKINVFNGNANSLIPWDFTLGSFFKKSDEITDIRYNWAYREIAYLIDQSYLAGYLDKTYRPNNSITRAEFATMISNVLNPKYKAEFNGRNFNDINGHWAKDRILHAARAGFMAGYSDGSFRPDNNITRQEILVSLANIASNTEDTNVLGYFYDNNKIPSWARPGLAKAWKNELIVNYPNTRYLNPTRTATRAEATALIYRALVWTGNVIDPYTSPYLAQ